MQYLFDFKILNLINKSQSYIVRYNLNYQNWSEFKLSLKLSKINK